MRLLLIALHLLSPLAPLAFFFLSARGDIARALNAPGVILGVCAFVWLCWQFVLTARVRPLEYVFGQDRLIRLHILVGLALLGAVWAHSGLIFNIPGEGAQSSLGGAAWGVLGYVGAFSLFFLSDMLVSRLPILARARDILVTITRLNHNRALLIHRVLGLGLLLALGHALLAPGRGLFLFKAILAGCFAIAALAQLNHQLLRPRRQRAHPWRVRRITIEAPDVRTLELEPPAGRDKPRHEPGQFAYIEPLDGPLPREAHPFTIASAPDAETLSFSIKAVGDFTERVAELSPGDRVRVDGPYGRFTPDLAEPEAELVLIAGGVGVTPFLSMLRDLSAREAERSVILIWGARSRVDLIRFEELQAMARRAPWLRIHYVLSRDPGWNGLKGRVDEKLLRSLLGSTPAEDGAGVPRDFFLCGPAAAMDCVARSLKNLGVTAKHIHNERFRF